MNAWFWSYTSLKKGLIIISWLNNACGLPKVIYWEVLLGQISKNGFYPVAINLILKSHPKIDSRSL